MDTFNAIEKRSSVREYSDREVSKEVLEKLINAARMAPSARAVEPLNFIAIKDKEKLSRIAGLAPNGKFISRAQAGIVVVSSETKYYLEDGCAATENILLQASDLGLGACWIAGDKKPYAQALLDLLEAPKGMKLVSIISLGWPREEPARKERKPLKDILHWEKF